MVDEAHSFGVMGAHGLGIREHFGLPSADVDIWMGTLSKALAGCGGYIAGEAALVEHLKFLAPAFSIASACRRRLPRPRWRRCSNAREPERVATLQARGRLFLAQAQAAGVDTGTCAGFAVIPGNYRQFDQGGAPGAALFERGINVQPILYPAVPEKSARSTLLHLLRA
jgi:8-amino-7-oxononanoate synthase